MPRSALVNYCRMFIVTVDGPQSGWSRGMRFLISLCVMLRLGADDAVNLYGGGSTLAWIHERRAAYCERRATVAGCFANRILDGNERTAVMSYRPPPAP